MLAVAVVVAAMVAMALVVTGVVCLQGGVAQALGGVHLAATSPRRGERGTGREGGKVATLTHAA